MWLLVFDAKNHLIGIFEISHGSYTQASLNPAQILQRALLCGAGQNRAGTQPSERRSGAEREDRTLTERIKAATNLIAGSSFNRSRDRWQRPVGSVLQSARGGNDLKDMPGTRKAELKLIHVKDSIFLIIRMYAQGFQKGFHQVIFEAFSRC